MNGPKEVVLIFFFHLSLLIEGWRTGEVAGHKRAVPGVVGAVKGQVGLFCCNVERPLGRMGMGWSLVESAESANRTWLCECVRWPAMIVMVCAT